MQYSFISGKNGVASEKVPEPALETVPPTNEADTSNVNDSALVEGNKELKQAMLTSAKDYAKELLVTWELNPEITKLIAKEYVGDLIKMADKLGMENPDTSARTVLKMAVESIAITEGIKSSSELLDIITDGVGKEELNTVVAPEEK